MGQALGCLKVYCELQNVVSLKICLSYKHELDLVDFLRHHKEK